MSLRVMSHGVEHGLYILFAQNGEPKNDNMKMRFIFSLPLSLSSASFSSASRRCRRRDRRFFTYLHAALFTTIVDLVYAVLADFQNLFFSNFRNF